MLFISRNWSKIVIMNHITLHYTTHILPISSNRFKSSLSLSSIILFNALNSSSIDDAIGTIVRVRVRLELRLELWLRDITVWLTQHRITNNTYLLRFSHHRAVTLLF
jgi:hypothetical protein